jgi:EmrB/QacA subfamily drug resistance transporter
MADVSSPNKMSPKDLMIVIVIALGSFMAGLDGTIVNIALPDIAKSFDISTVMVTWVLNAYLIVMVSLLLPASRIGDMKGYRNIFLAGFVLFTLGSMLCGIAPTIGVLVLSRMLQAVGGAIISALGAVMVTTYLSPSLRGQALGIVAMFVMLGAALGPVAGGFLTSTFSWRSIFYVNLPVGIIAVLLGLHVLPHAKPVVPETKLDVSGIVLFFIALSLLVIGLTSVQGDKPLTGSIALILSLAFWIAFILQERRTPEPLIQLSLFANRAFTLQNINLLLVQMSMVGVMVVMPFYLELVKKIPTDHAGAVLLALPVGMILTAPAAGRISDVIGTRKPAIAGFALSAVALASLSTLTAGSGIGFIAFFLFLVGAGTGMALSPLTSAVMGEVAAEERGSASGLMRVMMNLGATLGVAVVMLVATVAAGPKIAQVSASLIPAGELAGAMDAAFFFCMLLEIAGVLLMLAVRDRKSSGESSSEVVMGF